MDGAKVGGQAPVLEGLRVLIVEDEALVSMMLEDMLTGFGCVIAGIAATVAEGLAAVDRVDGIDVAILDVNLGGQEVFPVADALIERRAPIVFSTGFAPADLARRYPHSRLLSKPYTLEPLAKILSEAVGR